MPRMAIPCAPSAAPRAASIAPFPWNQNLRRIRPGHGLPPKYYDILLGKRVNQAVKKGTPVSWSLFD